jgi:hypothetical protein
MTDDDLHHYSWLVESRRKNQQFLVELLRFSQQHGTAMAEDPLRLSVFQLLVGVGFSLWRAAFLMDVERTRSGSLDHANQLLLRLVKDNAVNYPQEQSTRRWMAGFHLNNARFRLGKVKDRLKLQIQEAQYPAELGEFDRVDQSAFEDERSQNVWDIMHNASLVLFAVLRGFGPGNAPPAL